MISFEASRLIRLCDYQKRSCFQVQKKTMTVISCGPCSMSMTWTRSLSYKQTCPLLESQIAMTRSQICQVVPQGLIVSKLDQCLECGRRQAGPNNGLSKVLRYQCGPLHCTSYAVKGGLVSADDEKVENGGYTIPQDQFLLPHVSESPTSGR